MTQTGGESPLKRQRRPDAESRKYLPLMSPRIGQTIHAIAINNDVEGVLTHWIDNQTSPCLGALGDCPGCMDHRKPRWKGFLPAVLAQAGTIVLLEITPGAVESCPALRGDTPALRGHAVKLYRRGTSKRSPCVLEVGGLVPRFLPPEKIDVFDVLHRLWGVNAIFSPRVGELPPDDVPMP